MPKIITFLVYFLCFSPACLWAQGRDSLAMATDTLEASRQYKLAQSYTYNNPALSKKHCREAIRLAHRAGVRRLEAAATNVLGLSHRNLSEYDSALVCFKTAEKMFGEMKYKTGYGNSRNNYAMTLFYLGEYEKANTLLLKVIEEAREDKLYRVLSNAHQNMGIMHNSQQRYREALANFVRAEEYHRMVGDEGAAAGAANNQAFIYFKHLKQYDKAIAIYKRTLPIKQARKDEKGVGIIVNNLAELYLIKKEYDKALASINKAIAIREKIDDQYGLTVSCSIVSEIYFQQKNYRQAEVYAQKAVDIARKIGAKKELSDALKQLSKIQKDNNDINKAYQNYVAAMEIEDSLLNRENFARMAELETKYATARHEREILTQRAEIAESQLRIDQQNMIILGVCAVAVIAILIGFVVYNRQKLKTIRLEKEAELKEALRFIETQNQLQEQRLTISRDLHDNIGSQLTFIISSMDNLKYSFDLAGGLKDKIAGIRNFTKDTITELRDTIWAMNKEEITLQDLSSRISNFIENAKAASKGIHFEFSIDSAIPETRSFTSLRGINLYRVIQESVNNALKHAEADRISVSFTTAGKGYTITIKDNGKGFDASDAGLGNGLANIRKRVADSGGELALVSSPDEGTSVIIHLK